MLNKKDLFYVEASLPVLNADKWGGREITIVPGVPVFERVFL
jgi:hypothetical protein